MVVRKMKDKCKDAARMRREKERAEFVELSRLLPLPSSTTSQLDKASIIRLTSSYLRMRAAFPDGLGENWGQQMRRPANSRQTANYIQQHLTSVNLHCQPPPAPIRELGSLILQTLDGFVFAMHKDGKIMYVSETASVHLGLPQIDLTGSSVFEYVHPSDHNDIHEILSLSETDKDQLDSMAAAAAGKKSMAAGGGGEPMELTRELGRSFCMRMKCILPKRNAGLVSSGYKAIHCNGYLKVRCKALPSSPSKLETETLAATTTTTTFNQVDPQQQPAPETGTRQWEWESYALVAVGHSLLPTASTEVKLTGDSFMFRANLDFKFYFVETMITELLGLEQFDLIGQSLYQFVHVGDLKHLENSHRLLLEKGQVITKYFRLMRKDGGFIWVQSYATLVNNPRNMPKPQHIVSICMILGDCQSDQSRFTYEHNQQSSKATATKSSSSNETRSLDSAAANSVPTNHLCHHHQQLATRELLSNSVRTTTGANGSPINPKKREAKYAANQQQQQQQQQRRTKRIKSQDTLNQEQSIKRGLFRADKAAVAAASAVQHQLSADQFGNHASCMMPTERLSFESNDYYTLGQPAGMVGIGAANRRASDDSCSIVSSVASTSVSSRSSTHVTPDNNYFGYPLSDHVHDQSLATAIGNQSLIGSSSSALELCGDPHMEKQRSLQLIQLRTNCNHPDERQLIKSSNNVLWSTMAAEHTEFTTIVDIHPDTNNHGYNPDCRNSVNMHHQFVQISNNQPWLVSQTQTCSNSFVADDPIRGEIHHHIPATGYHHINNSHHQPLHQQHYTTDELYFDSSAQYNNYVNHSANQIHHQVPPTDLYSV